MSLILFKSPDNALDRLLLHFVDLEIESQEATTTTTTTTTSSSSSSSSNNNNTK